MTGEEWARLAPLPSREIGLRLLAHFTPKPRPEAEQKPDNRTQDEDPKSA